jgi:hypothetical protein
MVKFVHAWWSLSMHDRTFPERKRERERELLIVMMGERDTDEQSHRQTDRLALRQAGRQTDRQM